MKKLTLIGDSKFKIADTGTLISFKAFDNDHDVSFTKNDQLQFKIRNSSGYIMSVDGIVSGGGYWVNLNTKELTKLTPDTYECELWDTKDGMTDIYPDAGFVPFTVTANATIVTGSVLPSISLDEYESKFEKYCDDRVATAENDIKADFQKFIDSIQNNTIDKANKASQDATNAVSTANSANEKAQQAVNTANGMSNRITANTSLIQSLNLIATNNGNSINNGLGLDFAKSFTQANTSKNLVINSSMQTKADGIHPYTDWQRVWGWVYSNGNLPGRKNWYGHEAIQANQITNSVALLSQGVYAGTQRGSTVYSARVHYRKYGDLTNTTFTFYLEYAYQADFQNAQKVEIGSVNKDSNNDDWIIKENISVPEGYNWIRLRVEANTAQPESYLFIGSPMINYGNKALDYVPSNQTGQRISAVESDIETMQQQITALTAQIANNQVGG